MSEPFIPWGTGCEALVSYPDEMVRCGDRAVGVVHVKDRQHYVCSWHRDRVASEQASP